VIKVKVTVTKKEIQFPLNNFSLLWPIDTKLAVWVAYIKTQLGIATQVYVNKVKVRTTLCIRPNCSQMSPSIKQFATLPEFFLSQYHSTCRWLRRMSTGSGSPQEGR